MSARLLKKLSFASKPASDRHAGAPPVPLIRLLQDGEKTPTQEDQSNEDYIDLFTLPLEPMVKQCHSGRISDKKDFEAKFLPWSGSCTQSKRSSKGWKRSVKFPQIHDQMEIARCQEQILEEEGCGEQKSVKNRQQNTRLRGGGRRSKARDRENGLVVEEKAWLHGPIKFIQKKAQLRVCATRSAATATAAPTDALSLTRELGFHPEI
ncbi:hypothetical protein C8F04DRAFT_1183835 [Mycena alexandri]|uniref:Uncharacterized protein n=1 Tax=Mycena alexandri TaxID=1745969 RepID=A0AAD6SWA2_9AGAR|nr:hypothetical protein C8F04DRAFT_1183835 [Mycena alexandri]